GLLVEGREMDEMLMIMGIVSYFGGDDILAVFIAGTVLSWLHQRDWYKTQTKHSHFQEVIDHLFNLLYFVYFGAVLPWRSFGTHVGVWRLVGVSVWMLTVRRVPAVLGLARWVPALRNFREAVFAAWFGPMGASAIFYALLAHIYLEVSDHPLLEIVTFVVLSSIIIHGGSVPFFQMGLERQITLEQAARQREMEGRSGSPDTLVERSNTETTVVVVGGGGDEGGEAGKGGEVVEGEVGGEAGKGGEVVEGEGGEMGVAAGGWS
ncbi:hypothetical protein HDU67_008104, partial [Dinochytrium kinnereticum]